MVTPLVQEIELSALIQGMGFEDGQHPIFIYTVEEKRKIRQEIGMTEKSIDEDVDALQEWFGKQPHLSDAGIPDRDILERVLLFAKSSRERAKQRIDNYHRFRTLAPELWQEREKVFEDAKTHNFFHHATIPKLYNLKRITVMQFHDPDPNNFFLEAFLKKCGLLADIRMKYEYTVGDIWVLDLKNAGVGHLMRVNPLFVQKATRVFQECIGIRVLAIHVLGASSFAQKVVKVFGSVMKPKVMGRLKVHSSVKELYEYIPKEYLPKDYGGDEPWMEEFRDKYRSFLSNKETKDYLAQCLKMVSDESKRINGPANDELCGSFKKLEVD